MENQFVISSNVRNRMKNLSREEQELFLETYVCDEISKTQRKRMLTPVQELLYLFIHDYIMRDTMRLASN